MTKGVDPLEIGDDYIGFFETALSNEPARALRQPRDSYEGIKTNANCSASGRHQATEPGAKDRPNLT
jgi:hypothetical protein